MSEQGYLVVQTTEDGDVLAEFMDRETLLHRLDINYWGAREILALPKGQIVDLYAKAAIYIVKGEMITPKPKQVVTAWDVP